MQKYGLFDLGQLRSLMRIGVLKAAEERNRGQVACLELPVTFDTAHKRWITEDTRHNASELNMFSWHCWTRKYTSL